MSDDFDVCELCGQPIPELCRIEGGAVPSFPNFCSIAQWLNLDADQVLELIQERPGASK